MIIKFSSAKEFISELKKYIKYYNNDRSKLTSRIPNSFTFYLGHFKGRLYCFISGQIRAFWVVRYFVQQTSPAFNLRLYLPDTITGQIEVQIKELKEYINDAFADYNDINEDTRIQMELINQALAELQAHKKLCSRPRKQVAGFVKNKG